MKLTKKLSIIVFSVTTTLISTAVITNTYNAAAQAAELVKNGSFELDPLVDPNNPNTRNPNITDWIKSGDPMDTSGIRIDNFPQHDNGNQGLSIGSFINPAYISQNLATTIGSTYNLSFFLGTDEGGSDVNNIFHTFVDGNKVFEKINTINTAGVPFTQYDFNFVATKSSTELKLGGKARYGFLYLDAVSVTPVPEPSSIGGIAIAGLVGIWLKKKKAIS
ncbi:MAG: PEP-CTERM sorting domain-containing protein [Nostoc sp. CmiVER01]|uniref:PEP-CTERM sorting domain-containing protein n=1 Tax=Nostoc sp. CmiVER01 TaxID=3075384 RepID=UPI002AD1DB8C|nr:PEP-CTERM sorting domain-containing protein [Nostoc sp. CmiVER01]MDZ8122881.1 PEP-CTERM sorting domain-containing protein [Nostoc sp. CmiVER01]